MKNYVVAGTLMIFACGSLIALAQDATKPAGTKPVAAKPADKADPKTDTKKGRLPANYGKLGLTEPQKTKIYGIQASYDEQLDALEKQLEALKSKRDQEVEAVLSEDQRKILKNLVDAQKDAKNKGKQDPADDAKGAKDDKDAKK